MARGEISLNDLAQEIGARTRVSYRLMLRRSDDRWTLQAMMVDAASVSHPPFVYDYGYVAFVGGMTAGSRVSSWLLKLKGRAGGFSFVIPKLQENVFSSRYPSHTRRDIFLSLPQPFSIHRISISGRTNYERDSHPLVKAGCPSFPNLAEAASQLLYGLPHARGNGEPEDVIVRVSHTEAWIELVKYI